MREFKVNEYITLKLERNKTFIYVNNERFNQCHYLLMNIPIANVKEFDGIESIDEIAEKLDHSNQNRTRGQFEIDPTTEFWGHCSNMQVWVEKNYDTRLLHSNLSFPLLKKLTDVGDPIAKKVFKEEIALRVESGYKPVISYLLREGYLNYLSEDELSILDEEIRKTAFKIQIKRLDEQCKKFDLNIKIKNLLEILKFYHSCEPTFKICALGDDGIGYNSFIDSLIGNFTEKYKMSLGVSFYIQKIDVVSENKPIKFKLQIWDCSILKYLTSVRKKYHKGAFVILVFFDITNLNSFNQMSQLIEEIDVPSSVLLIGNKNNIEIPSVTQKDIEKLINKSNLYYLETSLETREGMMEAYYSIFGLLFANLFNQNILRS